MRSKWSSGFKLGFSSVAAVLLVLEVDEKAERGPQVNERHLKTDDDTDAEADTLDAFFLPSKRAVRRGSHSPKLDVGIDANALTDHHRVAGENTLEAATRTSIVKKFGEGFVPHRDNVTENGFP